uniref:Ubiquitin-like protease family profile domain-containing protein n=1 Tax=Magallana gigas TaxID=29159 RepID=A0A8W8LC31_MAGGI
MHDELVLQFSLISQSAFLVTSFWKVLKQKEEGSTSALIGPYQVNAEDIKSLDGSNWITDQVVNSYLYMIQSYTNDTAFMDSFWVPHCIKKGVMQVREVNNLEHKRVLLIPVHKPAHWGLVIVYIQEGYFVVVDTLKAFGKEVATIVRRFLLRHKIVAPRNKALEQIFKPPFSHMDHCRPLTTQKPFKLIVVDILIYFEGKFFSCDYSRNYFSLDLQIS